MRLSKDNKTYGLRKRIKLFAKILLGKKGFAGHQFERFIGLEYVLNLTENKSVLDIGCNNGLISYEFARHGAVLIP